MSLTNFGVARCLGSSYADVILHWLSTNSFNNHDQRYGLKKSNNFLHRRKLLSFFSNIDSKSSNNTYLNKI